jgi:hypothetical protein
MGRRARSDGQCRRGGRVVEGTGLENRQARKRLEGSNPSPSASLPLGSNYRLTRKQTHWWYPPIND